MRNVKNTMIDTLLSVVAPHLCSGCGKVGGALCIGCKKDIINEAFRVCAACGITSGTGVCRWHGLAYSQAWIIGTRQGALQRLVGGFKFRNMKASAKSLAELMHLRLPPLPADTVIVPIPTAPGHIRERGYDHTLLIAQHLSVFRRFELRTDILVRDGVKTQHHANRSERKEQAVGAFTIDKPIQEKVPYLILDDVITTGSTIDAASRLLRRAGAETIWVAAIARQPLD